MRVQNTSSTFTTAAGETAAAPGTRESTTDPVQGYSPAGQLLHLMMGYWVSQAIHAMAQLGVADHLRRTPQTIDTLAARVGAHSDSLYRVLRALASIGVVAEPLPRQFALTAMSALLRTDAPGNLCDFAKMQGDGWHWDSWREIVASVRGGRPGVELAHGAAHCFALLAQHPASAATFNAAMGGFAANAHAAVVDAYDFSAFRRIVDIGGGQGMLIAALLPVANNADATLFDQPDVIDSARPLWTTHPLAARTTLVAGDFFLAVPAAADCYLLASILHDWNDVDATRILARIAQAMAPDGRVIVIEMIVPTNDDDHPSKWVDLEMMLITGGRERTEAEYQTLFLAAGLTITRVTATAATVSIIEARRC